MKNTLQLQCYFIDAFVYGNEMTSYLMQTLIDEHCEDCCATHKLITRKS